MIKLKKLLKETNLWKNRKFGDPLPTVKDYTEAYNKKYGIVEGYQGWKNWDTWNANLHLTNDESAYNQYMKLKNAKSIKSFFISNFGKSFDKINTNKVDWQEIYDAKDE